MKLHTLLIAAMLSIPSISLAQEKTVAPVEKPTITKTLEDSLVQNIDKLTEFLSSASNTTYDFASKEVPIFIQEYLLYHFWLSLILTICAVFLDVTIVCVVIVLLRKLYIYFKSENDLDSPGFVLPTLAGSFVALVFFCCIFLDIKSNAQWLQIKLAPRVYMVQELKSFIGK